MTTRTIIPVDTFRSTIRTPGDKSISHRALMLAAIAPGQSSIRGLSDGEDVGRTKVIIEQLGATVISDGDAIRVVGPLDGLRASSDLLYCGNSGTTMRLLLGLVSGIPGVHRLDGDASLRRRPMDRVAVPLARMGVQMEGEGAEVRPPVVVHGRQPVHAIEYDLPTASAQVKSAILLAALSGDGTTTIVENIRTRANTEEMLRDAGVEIESVDVGEGRRISIAPSRPKARDWIVPGDPSQAAFFIVAALIHPDAAVKIEAIYDGPERLGFLSVLDRMGGTIRRTKVSSGLELEALSSALVGVEIHSHEIPSVDEVPILVVAACAATGTSTFIDMSELRIKESDRFAESVALARSLGADVSIDGDSFSVTGLGTAANFSKFVFSAPHDHRMAMSAAIAGFCGAGAEIDGTESVLTSFPNFFELLTSSL